jgi:Transposase, Mutator family
VLAQVPKGSAEMVAATIRTIFAQPGPGAALYVSSSASSPMLGRQFPRVEAILHEAADDITAFAAFPLGHWKKIWSTNPLERLNKEIERRTDVVGVFPNPKPSSGWPAPCWSKPTTMAGRRTTLPIRRFHGPAHHPDPASEGGSHTSTAHGIVTTSPLTRR